MPFLFVDYDQGAGGEFFCANLSQSPQCIPLKVDNLPNQRYKAYDMFDQEFLKTVPHVDVKPAPEFLYAVVPTHRYTQLAKDLLTNVRSIRITEPEYNSSLWSFYKHQQLHKVYLRKLPSPELFVGEVKMLLRTATNPNFLREIDIHMDGLELILRAANIEPTEANRKHYIESYNKPRPDPLVDYDLVIPYEDLFFNINKIKESILNIFGIVILSPWLETYQKNYEAYLSQT
jgi:hypothetical protein